MNTKMRISELADQAGVTPRTIRYYESLGLLGPNERVGHGFRYYTEAELSRLRKIDALKQLGLSLEEISEVIPLYCEDPTGVRSKQRVLEILQNHLSETDEKLQTLQQFRCELVNNIKVIARFIQENSK
jgi:DNA-binding transcriptional MerR regulator